jgi:hypothetical protein
MEAHQAIAALALRTGIAPRDLLATPEITDEMLDLLDEQDRKAKADEMLERLRARRA